MKTNITRFADRVEDYKKYRPGYPFKVIEILRDKIGLASSAVIADIGSGTGISSSLFINNGNKVFAVEPNTEMRKAAEISLSKNKNFFSINGSAENTGLTAKSIDLIFCAQAFHWFDKDLAKTEFRRILKTNGNIVLVWNMSNEKNPFVREYVEMLQSIPEYGEVNYKNISEEDIAKFFSPQPLCKELVENVQMLNLEELKGRLRSSSYCPKKGIEYEKLMKQTEILFHKFEKNGRVKFDYETKIYWGGKDKVESFDRKRLAEQGLNPDDPHLQKVLQITREYMGFPRQLGQHTGGFVITRGKLSDLVPVLNARMENRTCIEWNKDDIDALGFMKIDVLALGMLTCIRKAFDLAKENYGLDLTLANIPQDDPAVYDMICRADTIGVFQIESRAQQSMLPRLKPRCFYDLVIEVAIVRPGPIQGDMVHPYLRRRNGEEPVEFPSKELEEILGRTLGVPLFQEQAMKIAIVAAGFTAAEADELRRSMATFKAKGLVSKFQEKLVNGMMQRGYTMEYAQRVFKQLEGFGSYGFPESHAASFALLVYVSSWLKCYYPDVFAAALLNSMPMGFYQPAQIIIDARKHGVEVRPADINYSNWDNRLEEKAGKYCALRLGFRQIKGLRQDDIELLIAHRKKAYSTINELRDVGIADAALEKLADADAFRSIGLDRREALWEVSAKDRPVALFSGQPAADAKGENISLPKMTASEHVVYDYSATSLSLKAHPVSFVREKLNQLHIGAAKDLATLKDGNRVKIAGLVLVRQRPGTARGICFMTIEDETGFANIVIFEKLFEKYRKEILQSRLIMVEGKLQIEGEVIHVIAQRCYNFSSLLKTLTPANNENLPLLTLAFPDEKTSPPDVNKNIAG